MDRTVHQRFAVGNYQVAPLEGRIYGPTGARQLPDHSVELLESLAKRPGELVERNQLIEDVWHGVKPSDRALSRCVGNLRRCFGDSSANPRYIETVPGLGYRLIAPVKSGRSHQRAGQPISQRSRNRWRWPNCLVEMRQRKVCRAALLYMITVWVVYQLAEIVVPALLLPDWVLTLVVLLGILGFPLVLALAWALELTPQGVVIDLPRAKTKRRSDASASHAEIALQCLMLLLAAVLSVQLAFDSQRSDDGRASTTDDIRTLAVRPLLPAVSNPQSETLGQGLVDELRYVLRETGHVQVMAASAGDLTATQHLGVDAVLEVGVYVDASSVRATVHLVDPRTGYDFWSIALDEPSDSPVRMQTKLARRIAAQLPIAPALEHEAEPARAESLAMTRSAPE